MVKYNGFAKLYLGTKEGSDRHHYIIDYYNKNIKPLPRNYKVKYTDSWCATFVSFVLKKCGADSKKAPYECSAQKMRELAIKKGIYRRDNPKEGDIVFYCWNGTGVATHVGFVNKINGKSFTTIEGNYEDKVKERRVVKGYKAVLGYATVPQATVKATKKSNKDKVVEDVIKGKYGNGKEREEKLKAKGYNPDEIQKLVNSKLKTK